jgi:hypothetical protein
MPKRVNAETHQKQKYRYNERSRCFAFASGSRWSQADVDAVCNHNILDSVLSKQIGRSIQAIHMCRIRRSGAYV